MKNLISLPFPRKFVIWQYHVNRSRLLIRSGYEHNKPATTRIDIFLELVRSIHLPSHVVADKITENTVIGNIAETSAHGNARLHNSEEERRFYFSYDGKEVGYVYAKHIEIIEDTEKNLGKSRSDNINLLLGCISLDEYANRNRNSSG